MQLSQDSVWMTSLMLALTHLLLHQGEARVFTEVQAGPLYRVLGYPLTIACSTSGFSDPNAQQDFEFRMYQPQRPDREINVVSTNDPNFAFSRHARRIKSQDITLEHVSHTSVLFTIKKLLEEDEGEYECSVVNSEHAYDGTYSAKTTVKVIENSLTVSPDPGAASVTHTEGDALTVACQASRNTLQHTHLSVAWYLHGDGAAPDRPIMSLDKDLILSAGQGFERRYQAGQIGLQKVGEATYQLRMAPLELSDQGRIYCRAQEWIQDPDRSWYPVAQNETEVTTLTVRAKEVAVDPVAPSVRISAQASVEEGQELKVCCTVDAVNQAGRLFSVAWLRDDLEVARIGPAGILSVGPEYGSREHKGELIVTRTGTWEQQLTLRLVRRQDQGRYMCRAWPQEIGAGGAFTEGPAQDSTVQPVSILAKESGLSVEMMTKHDNITEGDILRLDCTVNGFKGQLSVTWQHRPLTTPSFTDVIGLSREGVTEPRPEYRHRTIQVMRPTADTFTLVLPGATGSDAGTFRCIVSEWTPGTDGNMESTSDSASTNVEVHLAELKMKLRSRAPQVTMGDPAELLCDIRGPRLPVAVTWSLQRPDTSYLDNILTWSSEGSLIWHGGQGRFQLKTASGPNQVTHTLQLPAASHAEEGRYQCGVSFLQQTHRKPVLSNLVAVKVNNPATKLQVKSTETQLTKEEDEDVELDCTWTSEASSSSWLYNITWFYSRPNPPLTKVPLAALYHNGLLMFTENQGLQHLQGRLRLSRPTHSSLHLGILKIEDGDGGTYQCQVDQYQLDPQGKWLWTASDESGNISLTVRTTETNFSLLKEDSKLNVSADQEFTVPCDITAHSSQSSVFQVTWFWHKEAESIKGKGPQSILTAHRDSTLQPQDGRWERLRYIHPLPNSFQLLVTKATTADSGRYFCEVEEWLHSRSLGWRKMAVGHSGEVAIVVLADGKAEAKEGCSTVQVLVILLIIITCLLVLVAVLVMKIRRSASTPRKADSLWAEGNPLKPKPAPED